MPLWPLRMEFLLNFGVTPEAAILTTSGVARVDDFRMMSEALVDNPRFRAGMPILIDHTSLDASVLTATDVRAIGEFVATVAIHWLRREPRAAPASTYA